MHDEFEKAARRHKEALDGEQTLLAARDELRRAINTNDYASIALVLAHTLKTASDTILALSGESVTVNRWKEFGDAMDIANATTKEELAYATLKKSLVIYNKSFGPAAGIYSVGSDIKNAATDIHDTMENAKILKGQLDQIENQLAKYRAKVGSSASELNSVTRRAGDLDSRCASSQ